MKDYFKGLGAVTTTIIVVAVLCFVLTGGVWLLRVEFADEIGKGNAQIELQSAPNRISAYNQFFDACASIQALEISIDTQSALLPLATNEYDKSRILTNLAGIQGQRASAIAQYNANAAKDWTVGQFRDSDLPYHLDSTQYVAGGVKTECNF